MHAGAQHPGTSSLLKLRAAEKAAHAQFTLTRDAFRFCYGMYAEGEEEFCAASGVRISKRDKPVLERARELGCSKALWLFEMRRAIRTIDAIEAQFGRRERRERQNYRAMRGRRVPPKHERARHLRRRKGDQ
ncbi:MAG TPA: hypothetical protein VG841_02395 [Caulobacterales bacterium]|nr:hypothetical protein [Caulobacterales bacterium]